MENQVQSMCVQYVLFENKTYEKDLFSVYKKRYVFLETLLIKTETDSSGVTNYTITATSLLVSVPYAFHAKTA